MCREKHYRGWRQSDPPKEEPLVAFQVPRNSIGHPGFKIPEDTSLYEMERMKVFLATESTHQRLKKNYDQEQKVDNLLMDIDST